MFNCLLPLGRVELLGWVYRTGVGSQVVPEVGRCSGDVGLGAGLSRVRGAAGVFVAFSCNNVRAGPVNWCGGSAGRDRCR